MNDEQIEYLIAAFGWVTAMRIIGDVDETPFVVTPTEVVESTLIVVNDDDDPDIAYIQQLCAEYRNL